MRGVVVGWYMGEEVRGENGSGICWGVEDRRESREGERGEMEVEEFLRRDAFLFRSLLVLLTCQLTTIDMIQLETRDYDWGFLA